MNIDEENRGRNEYPKMAEEADKIVENGEACVCLCVCGPGIKNDQSRKPAKLFR